MKKILVILILLSAMSCGRVDRNNERVVGVSIAPLGWVVENIADTLVAVEVVVPVGVGPENFDPSPRQVAQLAESDIYFEVGLLDFEKELEGTNSVRLCETVDVIGGTDPHIWLSVKNMKNIAKLVFEQLSMKYPECESQFLTNYTVLDSTLSAMDAKFQRNFSGNENVLIVHPSLSYMARDYGFNQIAVEVDGKEPSAAYIKSLLDMIPKKGISTIYYSIQDNPQEAMTIASEAGIEARKYDPLSADWKSELEGLVESICRNQ